MAAGFFVMFYVLVFGQGYNSLWLKDPEVERLQGGGYFASGDHLSLMQQQQVVLTSDKT